MTRLESWALPGVPDILVCDSKGRFHLIELKYTKNNSVRLSPHQVGFFRRHEHASVWLFVRHDPKSSTARLLLYPPKAVVPLVMDGIKDVDAYAIFEDPLDWTRITEVVENELQGTPGTS